MTLILSITFGIISYCSAAGTVIAVAQKDLSWKKRDTDVLGPVAWAGILWPIFIPAALFYLKTIRRLHYGTELVGSRQLAS